MYTDLSLSYTHKGASAAYAQGRLVRGSCMQMPSKNSHELDIYTRTNSHELDIYRHAHSASTKSHELDVTNYTGIDTHAYKYTLSHTHTHTHTNTHTHTHVYV